MSLTPYWSYGPAYDSAATGDTGLTPSLVSSMRISNQTKPHRILIVLMGTESVSRALAHVLLLFFLQLSFLNQYIRNKVMEQQQKMQNPQTCKNQNSLPRWN